MTEVANNYHVQQFVQNFKRIGCAFLMIVQADP